MITIAQDEPRRVTGGVDTHKDIHVAAVLDELGRLLATASFPATRHGYRRLLRWLQSHGELAAVGVEGCGSWGAGLARYLVERGVTVVEVNRPNRQNRRLRGKSDTVDAEAAARAVLNGQATVTPKAGTGPVEAVRQLRIARSGAMKARTAAANQLHSLCDTAPDSIRAQLAGMTLKKKVAIAERWRPGAATSVETAARRSLATVARRWRSLGRRSAPALPPHQGHPRRCGPCARRRVRRRVRDGWPAPRHRRRQPGTPPPREVLRRAVRLLPGPSVVWEDEPTPSQPRR